MVRKVDEKIGSGNQGKKTLIMKLSRENDCTGGTSWERAAFHKQLQNREMFCQIEKGAPRVLIRRVLLKGLNFSAACDTAAEKVRFFAERRRRGFPDTDNRSQWRFQ